MPRSQRQLAIIVLITLSAVSLVLLFYYTRQRLFTQSEPIVLEA